MGPSHPDVELVSAALAGSAPARRKLVARIDPLIRAKVRVLGGRLFEGPDDVTQQIWVRLLDEKGRLAQFDPERGRSLESFVSMIAQQAIVDLTRRRQLQTTPLEEAPPPTEKAPNPEEQLEKKDRGQRLRVYLDQNLSVRGQLILRYLYDDEKPDQEVAALLGVKRQVVANWKHKIKKLAVEFLKSDE